MSKTTLSLLVAVLFAVGALYFLQKETTADPLADYPERQLAVADAGDIARIFIADRKGRTANFERSGRGPWIINDQYEASPGIMREVVNALSKLRIDHVPPAAVKRVVLEDIQSASLKVESFDAAGNSLKSIIIGPPTQDERHSYVLVEGYEEPFAVRIPGITGSITSLFDITNIHEFRSKEVVAFEPAEIASVRVEYPRNPGESFFLQQPADEDRNGESLTLRPLSEVVPVLPKGPDPQRLRSYLDGFNYLPLSRRAEQHPQIDSIRGLVPFIALTVVARQGDTTRLRAWPWHIRDGYGRIDATAQIANYWVDKDGEDFVVVSTDQIKKWFLGYASFSAS